MPFAFAELRLAGKVLATAFAAVLVGASAPADARLGRYAADLERAAISAAERAAIGADLAYVRESGGQRRAHVVAFDGGREAKERALDLGQADSYPAAATRDGALVVVRAEDRGAEHEESLVVVDPKRPDQTRILARATQVRNPSVAPDGSIAFESDVASFRDLFLWRGAGESATRLTDDPEGNYEPSFFPGGQRLAFTSSRDGQAEIYAMSSDGASPRRLTTSEGDDMRPLVSPNGQHIAFVSGRTGEDQIFVMGPNGEAQRPVRRGVTLDSEREHTWSPDGRRLAFVARARGAGTSKSRIYVWDAARDTSVQVTDGSSVCDMPAFSPDGRYIAYVSDEGGTPDLWLMRVDGTGAVRVFDRERAPGHQGRWLPTWLRSSRAGAR